MLYEINRNGNFGIITPIPTGVLAATLKKYMSYEKQGIEFMPHREWGIVRLYKNGSFPWGLLDIAQQILEKYCENGDRYWVKYVLSSKHPTGEMSEKLRTYQKEAIHAIIESHGGILCLPTGSGKTLTIIEYLKLMKQKSLIIVPTLDIKRQWEEYHLPEMTVSTYQNPKLKEHMKDYDIVVFDECHHLPASSLYRLSMKVGTNTIMIGCSATVEREDREDMKIHAALGQIVYQKSRKELIQQGWLANAKVIYLKTTPKTDGKYMTYPEVYVAEIINNEERNKLIIDTAIKAYKDGRKILILVTQIEHGQKLHTLLNERPGPKNIFLTGQSKTEEREQDMSQYDIIIATTIYDEGRDIPTLDTIILAGAGQSSIKLNQRIGRILRPKPDGRPAIIYDFINSTKYLKRHYLKRRKLLEEEFEVIEDGQMRLEAKND